MRWRPTRDAPGGVRGVEVEIVEDDDDDVLGAMAAARSAAAPILVAADGVRWFAAPPADSTTAVLDPDAEPGRHDADGDHPGGPDRRGAGLRRPHPRRVAVVVAVVALVAAVNVVDMRREAARIAALQSVPGVLDPLDRPIEPVWSISGRWSGDTGDLVLVAGTPDVGLQAVRPDTGAVEWTRPVPAGSVREFCRPVSWLGAPPSLDEPAGVRPGAGDDDTVLCASQATVGTGEDGLRSARVAAVDGGTGRELRTFEQSGQIIDLASFDPATVVVAVVTPEEHLAVTEWDIGTGAERWAFRTADPLGGPRDLPVDRVQRIGDVLVVGAADSVVAVDLSSGIEVDRVAVERSRLDAYDRQEPTRVTLDGGDVAVWRPEDRSGHVEDADGDVLFRLAGPVRPAVVDDGSRPDLLLTGSRDGRLLRAVERTTGKHRWTGRGDQVLLRLDDVVLARSEAGDRVHALSLRTGDVRWSVPWESSVVVPVLTDGTVFLAPAEDQGTREALVARSLTDGTDVWRTVLPDGTYLLRAMAGGDLVAVTQSGAVGLGHRDG